MVLVPEYCATTQQLRKAKAEALKRGLVARSCARSGRKDVVGEVEGNDDDDVVRCLIEATLEHS